MNTECYGDDEEEVDHDFEEDMEALRRACILTGAQPKDLVKEETRLALYTPSTTSQTGLEEEDSEIDDFHLLQQLQKRFCDSVDALYFPSPAATLPSISDDDETHDLETLLAVRRRFASYDNDGQSTSDCPREDLPPVNFSTFPDSARLLVDAIKKNRQCQKFIRLKLTQLEARMEENKKLRERVKILKDFQLRCKKLTGRMFSTEEDPRVQLISPKRIPPESTEKASSYKYKGPKENAHVADYKSMLQNLPLSYKPKPWNKTEVDNLYKGLRQQFQEKLLEASMERSGISDKIVSVIRDVEISPWQMREFIPQVNWEQLAALYVPTRCGGECESRWLNLDDPLINHGAWTKHEEKKILLTVMEKGMTNWVDVAASLKSNRTPFDCLSHFQRSLNTNIVKREWSKEEDEQLREAVNMYGESNWQSVAAMLPGRTGSQCSNRWMKSLHPRKSRKGRWMEEEDRRLRVAVKLFGPKNWEKIAGFIPGRMQTQCRERWVNSLDPSLNMEKWTEEEDELLITGIREMGYRWSKIAAKYLPRRTDNQCTRRWKVLFPDDVPILQAARRTKKAAFISNFVDREEDRPALGPTDFVQLPPVIEPSKTRTVRKKRSCEIVEEENDPLLISLRTQKTYRRVRTRREEVVQVSTDS